MRPTLRRDYRCLQIAGHPGRSGATTGGRLKALCASIVVACAGVLGMASTSHAADLEKVVEEQASRIEQLETNQRRLIRELDDTRVAGPAVSTAPAEDQLDSIDREDLVEYVDERIAEFEGSPVTRFLVSGYGTAGLADVQGGTTAFFTAFNPGFHFRMADSLHFVAELEIELEVEDGELETHIGLEFAQVDYLATDWLVVSAGKFLTPFNTFGPRLHPTWINKLASMPPIYGGHDSGGFIPVLANLGVMGSGGIALWSDDAKFNYAFYLGNGVTGEELSDPPDEDQLLDLEFNNSPDLDDGVTLGGRIGFLPIANFELGVSYMTGDPSNARYHLVGIDTWYRYDNLELRGEFARLTRKGSGVEGDVSGYWLQAAYRLRSLFPETNKVSFWLGHLEPVIRWGEVAGFSEKNRKQLALGLNYWLFESAPLKLTYEINDGAPDDNRFVLSFAYGF